jgi:hypothetical protein
MATTLAETTEAEKPVHTAMAKRLTLVSWGDGNTPPFPTVDDEADAVRDCLADEISVSVGEEARLTDQGGDEASAIGEFKSVIRHPSKIVIVLIAARQDVQRVASYK